MKAIKLALGCTLKFCVLFGAVFCVYVCNGKHELLVYKPLKYPGMQRTHLEMAYC